MAQSVPGLAPQVPTCPTTDFDDAFAGVPTVTVGGLPIAVLNRAAAADWMIKAAIERPRGRRPLFLTSANGEVIARAATDPSLRSLLDSADQIVADGQPLVLASRRLCRQALPERIATTDLFHDVAERAVRSGVTFYMLGTTPEELDKAVANVRRRYPALRLVGHCHGYLRGGQLDAKIAEIDRLAPDILWLAMGVPHEQRFVARYGARLTHVGMIKTSGGLFNFLSGTNRRAPTWMQRASLEWAYRVWLEPRRLFWRYAVTNPRALWLMATRSS